jgi:hypothetical protein
MCRKSLRLMALAMGLPSSILSAQEVIIQQQPSFFDRVFAPVTETVQAITAAPANPVYVSSPGQATIITTPSRVTTTTSTTRVIQTQTRVADPVFDSLSRQLRDILPDRRREAAFALGQLRNPRAVPLLLDRLRVDLNKNVRKACVVALSQIPDPAIPGYLERVAIYDPNAEVRQLATVLMRRLTETVIVETPVEVGASVTTTTPVIVESPATESIIADPTTTVIQGVVPPATAQAPQLKPRTTPGVIISEPIDKPAFNPVVPNGNPQAEPELKLKPSTPGSASKPATPKPSSSPPLSPPLSDPPPLEALPDEIPKNSRKDPTPELTKPRSA